MARTYESKSIPHPILMDVVCDRCGESCVRHRFVPLETYRGYLGPDVEHLEVESGKFHASWGFHSRREDHEWTAELCESCCEELKEWIAEKGGAMQEDHREVLF